MNFPPRSRCVHPRVHERSDYLPMFRITHKQAIALGQIVEPTFYDVGLVQISALLDSPIRRAVRGILQCLPQTQ